MIDVHLLHTDKHFLLAIKKTDSVSWEELSLSATAFFMLALLNGSKSCMLALSTGYTYMCGLRYWGAYHVMDGALWGWGHCSPDLYSFSRLKLSVWWNSWWECALFLGLFAKNHRINFYSWLMCILVCIRATCCDFLWFLMMIVLCLSVWCINHNEYQALTKNFFILHHISHQMLQILDICAVRSRELDQQEHWW